MYGGFSQFIDTPPETNIAPENGWLEYYFPFGKADFQILGRVTLSFLKFLLQEQRRKAASLPGVQIGEAKVASTERSLLEGVCSL